MNRDEPPLRPAPQLPCTEQLFEDAACGLLLTDTDGLIRRANRTFCAWIGFSADDLLGRRRVQDLLTIGGKIFYQTHWAPLLRMQGSVAEVKLEVLRADGKGVPMVMNGFRRQHGQDTFHDIAVFSAQDRHQYERELLAARKRAEKLLQQERIAQRFAEQTMGIVSHDLRNPLWAIQAGADILSRGELSEVQRTIVGRILRSTARANRLIADLLDFTQVRMGSGIKLSLTEVHPHRLAADSVEELRLAFPDRIIRHVASGEGTCAADGDRLAQLIGNLVGNAISYGARHAEVTVISRLHGSACIFEVHNMGRPIPADLVPLLFEPMMRGPDVADAGRSVGLGLFIVREIARAHGGEVSVRSDEKEGTLFSVSFPRTAPRPSGMNAA